MVAGVNFHFRTYRNKYSSASKQCNVKVGFMRLFCGVYVAAFGAGATLLWYNLAAMQNAAAAAANQKGH